MSDISFTEHAETRLQQRGISTPLSGAYEHEILRRTQARDLDEALRKIQAKA